MKRFYDDNRRKSTIIRYKRVIDIYNEVIDELGDISYAVSKSYIYGKIRDRTGLCMKTISFIINHVKLKDENGK